MPEIQIKSKGTMIRTIIILIISLFLLISCMPTLDSVDNCVETYHKELNAGTYTSVIISGPAGDIDIGLYYGKYECKDGKLVRMPGAVKKERRGFRWYKVN